MGIFAKVTKSQTEELYSVNLPSTKLIVGLGNIGEQYTDTRHNVGWRALEVLAQKYEFPPFKEKSKLSALISEHQLDDNKIILVKPTTLMNLSGSAAAAVLHYYKLAPEAVLVIYDELALDFGGVRTRIGGSDAGHNGVKSVTQAIGEHYARVRIGIGPKPEKIAGADFVLKRFSKAEEESLPLIFEEVVKLSESFMKDEFSADTRWVLNENET